MSDPSAAQSKSTILSHVRITPTIWMVFLIVCLAAGRVKTFQNDKFRAHSVTYNAAMKHIEQESIAQFKSDRNFFHSRRHPNQWTIAELEKEINRGKPFDLQLSTKHPERKTTVWRREPYGSKWTLEFDDQNHLVGMSANTGSNNAFAQLQPVSRATFEDTGEGLRKSIAHYGPRCWVIVLLAWFGLASLRPNLSDVLLMIATATAMAQLVSPAYSLQTMFSNDPLFFGAVMIAVSLAMLARTSPQLGQLVATKLLPRRYGIRWILALTAVIAILVRLGWYGYVIGSIMAAAIVWYLLMASVVNRPTA